MEENERGKHIVFKIIFTLITCFLLFAAAEIYIAGFPEKADDFVSDSAGLVGVELKSEFFKGCASTLKKALDNTEYFIETVKDNIAARSKKTPVITGRLFTCAAAVPVEEYTEVSSEFGERILFGKVEHHSGTDFSAKEGTSVLAAWPGKVLSTGSDEIYGNFVVLEHGKNLATRYCHLSEISVSIGNEISCGETIGKAGSTGRSTGSHLHFEVIFCGTKIDPKECLVL